MRGAATRLVSAHDEMFQRRGGSVKRAVAMRAPLVRVQAAKSRPRACLELRRGRRAMAALARPGLLPGRVRFARREEPTRDLPSPGGRRVEVEDHPRRRGHDAPVGAHAEERRRPRETLGPLDPRARASPSPPRSPIAVSPDRTTCGTSRRSAPTPRGTRCRSVVRAHAACGCDPKASASRAARRRRAFGRGPRKKRKKRKRKRKIFLEG